MRSVSASEGYDFIPGRFITLKAPFITLRDYFAGQALVGLIPEYESVRGTAVDAYRIADAMLEAREIES